MSLNSTVAQTGLQSKHSRAAFSVLCFGPSSWGFPHTPGRSFWAASADTLKAFKMQQALLGSLSSAFHSNSPLSSPGFTIKCWDITKTWFVGLSLLPAPLKIRNFWSPQGPIYSITQRFAFPNSCRQEGKALQAVASVTEVRMRYLIGKNK